MNDCSKFQNVNVTYHQMQYSLEITNNSTSNSKKIIIGSPFVFYRRNNILELKYFKQKLMRLILFGSVFKKISNMYLIINLIVNNPIRLN